MLSEMTIYRLSLMSLWSTQRGKAGASAHLPLPAAPSQEDYKEKMPASLRKMLALKVRLAQHCPAHVLLLQASPTVPPATKSDCCLQEVAQHGGKRHKLQPPPAPVVKPLRQQQPAAAAAATHTAG